MKAFFTARFGILVSMVLAGVARAQTGCSDAPISQRATEKILLPVAPFRDGAFRTDFKSATERVFVYGREVKDFRNVDYEAIAMLNVSATQELAHQMKAQQEELTQLQANLKQALAEKEALLRRWSVLEERDQAREDRLARMESALEKGSATTSYVSLKRP